MNKVFKLFIHQSLLKHKHYPLLFLLFRITATTTHLRVLLVFSKLWTSFGIKNRESSANYIWVICKPLPTSIPNRKPALVPLLIRTYRPSTTMLKRNGDRGSRCLRPLITSNSTDREPLIRVNNLEVEMHSSIHLCQQSSNPVYSITLPRKSQEMEFFLCSS
jgi:hypothetical protein